MIQLVTIKETKKLYKGEEPANSIELITFEEFAFEVVSQKDRFKVGDKALFVEPDYNIKEGSKIFDPWVIPNGDPKKSKLGKRNRIRAVKFNLHTGDGMSVYSNGILLTLQEVKNHTDLDFSDLQKLAEFLGLYKYQESEFFVGGSGSNKSAKALPSGLYKTDEINYSKCRWNFPLWLIGKEKVDGSSITIYYKKGKYGICSRNFELPLTVSKVKGKKSGLWAKFLNFLGYDINIYEEVPNDSPFIVYGKFYLDRLVEYCEDYLKTTGKHLNVCLRGELVGSGASNGSGNKNNPHNNINPIIFFFGADTYDDIAIKMPHLEYIELITALGFQPTKIVFNQLFLTSEDLLSACTNYFNMKFIEGLVVRNAESTLSAKVMSPDYDSKK